MPGKPTIAELETIMDEAAGRTVTIHNDGSITVETCFQCDEIQAVLENFVTVVDNADIELKFQDHIKLARAALAKARGER